jgi:dienelactone hydrolase
MLRPHSLTLVALLVSAFAHSAEPLPGTKPLPEDADRPATMVAGIDRYLMRELASSAVRAKAYWKPDFSSAQAYRKSVEANRERLKQMLGVVDQRLPIQHLEMVTTTDQPSLVAQTDRYEVHAVRWPVLPGVDGEGLLLEPKGEAVANVVALPDADWTPEMLVGLAPGVPRPSQFARRLAENRCRVLVPVLIDRNDTWSGNAKLGRMTNQPHREFVYRMAYEVGRHVMGYEVQKVLAAVDWFTRGKDHVPVGLIGYGEGGRLALLAAALDARVAVVVDSGSFSTATDLWRGPIDRNVCGYLREFGDSGVAMLVAPTTLCLERSKSPSWSGPKPARADRGGAAPGSLVSTILAADDAALVPPGDVYHALKKREPPHGDFLTVACGDAGHPGEASTLRDFWDHLTASVRPGTDGKLPTDFADGVPPADLRKHFDAGGRQKRQFDQLVGHVQNVLRDSESQRQQSFWSKLDTSSVGKYQQSTEPFRKQLWEVVLGKLPPPTESMNPRSRPLYDEPKWLGYEVSLDLYPDVFASGLLLLPKDQKPGEKRPVVVCQHGLEGTPFDVCNPRERTKYYNSFGAQLADRGYIVYAPQNPYIGHDKFRVLQRKANPLGLSLFSFIIRQHERTLDWLATLPQVDADRIAFYGLSYGGKTAMRVPAVLPGYCLSICSGDFNDWVWKNATTDWAGSYMFSGEYEMPEWDLGHTFNYAEMAALIAPRPFMVERGHHDGVGRDEEVAREYAKVRRLYAALNLPERTALEFFPGGHEIHGQGTFAFLDKHLKGSR